MIDSTYDFNYAFYYSRLVESDSFVNFVSSCGPANAIALDLLHEYLEFVSGNRKAHSGTRERIDINRISTGSCFQF